MSHPLVTVVILSYDRPRYLAQSLESIAAQTYSNLQTIVVDNPSPQSDAVRELVAAHPAVQLIAMPHNAGYAGGMNEGIRRAAGEFIYLTEDDMVTEPDAISAMVEYMERDPQAAIVSGIHYDNHGLMIHGGGFITLGSTFSQFLIGRDTPVPPALDGPFCASYATGAMMMLRRTAVETLGAFREDFFMYFEDVEICARFIRARQTVVIVPTARAKTISESPLAKTPRAVEFHKLKNLLAVHLLHAPARTLPEFLLRYAGLNLLRGLVTDRDAAMVQLRADLWVAARFPQLLRQRKQLGAHGRNA